jgi:regulator of sigma E protease
LSEFFSHPVPAVILLLGLLVFVHEFGHYLVGRAAGIAVEIFSIGFGPRLIGVTIRGTDYRISAIPIGGFVKFAGAHPAETVPEGLPGRPFHATPLPLRAATVFAGPIANFLLAITAYTVLGMNGIPHPPAAIGGVMEGSPAEAAGIKVGDVVTAIDGRPVRTWRDMEDVIAASPGKSLAVEVSRKQRTVPLALTPGATKTVDYAGRPVTIGRAGIVLGSLTPVVTVLERDAPAAVAGLATGDRVERVEAAGKGRDIRTYPQLAAVVQEIAQTTDVPSVTLTVRRAALPALPAAKPDAKTDGEKAPPAASADGEPRTIELPIAAVRALPKETPPTVALRALGIDDSQLTVAAAEGDIAAVLKAGDRLLAWRTDGGQSEPLKSVFGLREKLEAQKTASAHVTVLRDFAPVELDVPLKALEVQKPEGIAVVYDLPVTMWGQLIDPDPVIEIYDSPVDAVAYGFKETVRQTGELVRNVASLVTGDIPLKSLGGPMLIAKVAGESARRGWQTFLNSMALISVNLGLLNLFPIPVLDGGQLVLMAAEALKRRPLREAAIENFQKVGFAMVLALVVLATYNDLSRFWKSMLRSVVGFFQ